ncbi:MAG: hypothetical protein AAF213_05560 [Pseudomonadota bacterium]
MAFTFVLSLGSVAHAQPALVDCQCDGPTRQDGPVLHQVDDLYIYHKVYGYYEHEACQFLYNDPPVIFADISGSLADRFSRELEAVGSDLNLNIRTEHAWQNFSWYGNHSGIITVGAICQSSPGDSVITIDPIISYGSTQALWPNFNAAAHVSLKFEISHIGRSQESIYEEYKSQLINKVADLYYDDFIRTIFHGSCTRYCLPSE